jgi:hypothetical protein
LEVILTWAGCSITHRHEWVCGGFYAEGDALCIFLNFSVFKILTRSWDEILKRRDCFSLEMLTFGGSLSTCTLSTQLHRAKLRLVFVVARSRPSLFSHSWSLSWLTESPSRWRHLNY